MATDEQDDGKLKRLGLVQDFGKCTRTAEHHIEVPVLRRKALVEPASRKELWEN